jgi:DNA-binding beta-propeller fold protein YncE
MAVDSGSKFLFVTNAHSNDISVFAIDAMNGMLTPVPGSPFSAGTLPKGIAVAPSANLVFVANNGSNDISVFNFDPVTGALSPVAGSPFPGGTFPIGVITDVSGRFLYVTNTSLRMLSTTALSLPSPLIKQPGHSHVCLVLPSQRGLLQLAWSLIRTVPSSTLPTMQQT